MPWPPPAGPVADVRPYGPQPASGTASPGRGNVHDGGRVHRHRRPRRRRPRGLRRRRGAVAPGAVVDEQAIAVPVRTGRRRARPHRHVRAARPAAAVAGVGAGLRRAGVRSRHAELGRRPAGHREFHGRSAASAGSTPIEQRIERLSRQHARLRAASDCAHVMVHREPPPVPGHRRSCCGRTSSARPTASSCCSPRSTARSGPSPRACARRCRSSAPGSSR